MQTPKSRKTAAEVPQRTSPTATRPSRVAKASGNEPDQQSGGTPAKTPTERSPKVGERRSPRSPATEKKRPSRASELELQVVTLQDELKKAKEVLISSEESRQRAQQEADEAKQQLEAAITELEAAKRQLAEASDTEQLRIQELRAISQERDWAWQSEIEALRQQQSLDAVTLVEATKEVQRLRVELEAAAESEATHAKRYEDADTELNALRREASVNAANAERAKAELRQMTESLAAVRSEGTEAKQQLETAQMMIETVCSEGIHLRECLILKDTELEEVRGRVELLEGLLMAASCQLSDDARLTSEADRAKDAKTKIAYKTLESTKAELEQLLADRTAEVADLRAALVDPSAMVDALKVSLSDKEVELMRLAGENEKLKHEQAEAARKIEAAMAELELSKAAEQDARMRLGSATEQMVSARAASSEMEAELRRLRVQSDQWRKAAEAAAAALAGGGVGNGRGVARTGSLEVDQYGMPLAPGAVAAGGRMTLMSSPFSDEGVESPGRKSGGVLRRMSGLWKKSPK